MLYTKTQKDIYLDPSKASVKNFKLSFFKQIFDYKNIMYVKNFN